MTNLRRLRYFLGMKFVDNSIGIVLHQHRYVAGVMKKFNIDECNTTTTPTEVSFKTDELSDEE